VRRENDVGRRGWYRFRGYVDQLEEAMRLWGEQLAESEQLLAQDWQRASWRPVQQEALEEEVLRRALDLPFLGRLLRAAARRGGAIEDLTHHDFDGRPWAEGERESHLPSAQRTSGVRVGEAIEAGDTPAPARLRAAERSLAQRTRSLAIVLDNVMSPRNASAVLRTADAFGIQDVHLIQREGRIEVERAITTLAHRWLDLHWYADCETALAAFEARDYRLLAADFGPGAVDIDEIPLGAPGGESAHSIALCFGSEQRGVSAALREAADGYFYIPTTGFASYLNVSVAVAIASHRLSQRMREAGCRTPLAEDDRRELRRAWYVLLARGDEMRARQYLGWLENPPTPAPDRGPRTEP
jgi:tRNA (guanosine-2'-O-)-methyltransferase